MHKTNISMMTESEVAWPVIGVDGNANMYLSQCFDLDIFILQQQQQQGYVYLHTVCVFPFEEKICNGYLTRTSNILSLSFEKKRTQQTIKL